MISNKSHILSYFDQIKTYLKDTTKIHPHPGNRIDYNMYLSEQIDFVDENSVSTDPIYLIQQFYIDKNEERQKEILKCLKLNVFNNSIDKIYLLNERIYNNNELGIESEKIVQINIKERLTYKHTFDFIENNTNNEIYKNNENDTNNNTNAFYIISNSDIFFNKSILELKKMNIISNNRILALNRYDYKNEKLLTECELFDNGRPDSQDTWILHSSNNIKPQLRDVFNFNLGKPGCDNKMCYLFNILNYKCYNEPTIIKTYHIHNVLSRNYTSLDKINKPYTTVFPILNRDTDIRCSNQTYNIITENERLIKYINKKMNTGDKFIIPKIGNNDNKLAYLGILYNSNKKMFNDININTNTNNLKIFSQIYLDSFHNSDIYLTWEPWSLKATENNIHESIVFIYDNFKLNSIWSETLCVYNLIQSKNIWTQELKGKRILILSHFNDKIKNVINNNKIYNIELLPYCEFIFIDVQNFNNEKTNTLNDFNKDFNSIVLNIKREIERFDIALVSCGIYSNLILSQLFNMNKSGINMDESLQYLFGIYDLKFENENKEILKLYKNDYWQKYNISNK